MPELTVQLFVFLICVVGFTFTTAICDIRTRRIPNKFTLPFCALGLVYRLTFDGLYGLQDAALAFAIGFGMLFILWMVGGGGGGDVKLMGALSVWLGFKMTLAVLVLSTLFVISGTSLVILWSFITNGARRTKSKYLATGKEQPGKKKKASPETVAQKQKRRIMAFAGPVALATWVVLLWKLPLLPTVY